MLCKHNLYAAHLCSACTRIKQLESLLQQQYAANAGAELPAIKALSEKISTMEAELVSHAQESQYVHQVRGMHEPMQYERTT